MKQVFRVKKYIYIKTICSWRAVDFMPPNVGRPALLSPTAGTQPQAGFPNRTRLETESTPTAARKLSLAIRPLLSLRVYIHVMCTLALSQRLCNKRVFQKRLPTWGGDKNTSPYWVAHRKGKPFKRNFPWSNCRDKHFPSSGFWVWADEQAEKASDLLQFYRRVYPFVSSSCHWSEPEGRWAPWTAMGNENSTSGNQVGIMGLLLDLQGLLGDTD